MPVHASFVVLPPLAQTLTSTAGVAMVAVVTAVIALAVGVALGQGRSSFEPPSIPDDRHTAPEPGMVPYHAVAPILFRHILTPERLEEELRRGLPDEVGVGPLRRLMVAVARATAVVEDIHVTPAMFAPPLVAYEIDVVLSLRMAVRTLGVSLNYTGTARVPIIAGLHVNTPLDVVVDIAAIQPSSIALDLRATSRTSAVVSALGPVEAMTRSVIADEIRRLADEPPLRDIRHVDLDPLLAAAWEERQRRHAQADLAAEGVTGHR